MKLGATIGAFLGWKLAVVAITLSFFAAAGFVCLRKLRRVSPTNLLGFGPYLGVA